MPEMQGRQMNTLMPFQKEGVDFLKDRQKALLADEMGLGKSVMAICAINEINARQVLIVCPAGLKLNWQREMKRWLKNRELKIQVLNGRNDLLAKTSNVVIVNYDLLIAPKIFSQLLASKFAVGVFDESHYLKNRSAKRTRAVFLRGAIASKCVYKWFLTGTPILNRPVELYPLLKAVAPEVIAPYDSYGSYAQRFCDAFFDGFQLVAKGASHVDDLSVRLGSGFMLRRKKADVLKELPDKMYQMVSLPAKDSNVKKLLVQEFNWTKTEAKRQAVGADGADLARLRHELALSKVSTAVDHIENLLDSESKIVVFAYHRAVIAQLRDKLERYGAVSISGDTPSAARQAVVDKFQTDKDCRVFIGQIQAAGVGITLTAASTVVFVESSWVPGEIDQAVDRCHRIGQKDSVLVQFLVIAESLEEHMIRTVIDKRQTIAKIVDQSPEVAYLFT